MPLVGGFLSILGGAMLVWVQRLQDDYRANEEFKTAALMVSDELRANIVRLEIAQLANEVPDDLRNVIYLSSNWSSSPESTGRRAMQCVATTSILQAWLNGDSRPAQRLGVNPMAMDALLHYRTAIPKTLAFGQALQAADDGKANDAYQTANGNAFGSIRDIKPRDSSDSHPVTR